jgi:hypothetical protein
LLTCQLLNAKDGYFRNWGYFVDQIPGPYLGGGSWQAGNPVLTDDGQPHVTGDTATFNSIPAGKHTIYLVITVPSGANLGNYGGTIKDSTGRIIPVSGLDANHPFKFMVA